MEDWTLEFSVNCAASIISSSGGCNREKLPVATDAGEN